MLAQHWHEMRVSLVLSVCLFAIRSWGVMNGELAQQLLAMSPYDVKLIGEKSHSQSRRKVRVFEISVSWRSAALILEKSPEL